MKICSSLRYQVSGWVFCFFTEEYLEPFKGLKISCNGSFVCETEEASKILERIKQERSEASQTDGGHRAGSVSNGLLFCAHIKVPLCDWQPPFWPVVRRGLGGSRKKICLLVHPVQCMCRSEEILAQWYGLQQDLPLVLLALLALLSSTHPCFSLLLAGQEEAM